MAQPTTAPRNPWAGKPEIVAALHAAADRYGLERALLRALAIVESSGNPTAKSHAGAQGLLQLMPRTAQELGVLDPLDPRQNAMGGAKYLSQLLAKLGVLEHALHAYNWGPGNVAKGGPVPGSVQKYARDVVARMQVERLLEPFLAEALTPPAAPAPTRTASQSCFLCPSCSRNLRVERADDES
jgi:soluble lytic murein transglycosylase-like protein